MDMSRFYDHRDRMGSAFANARKPDFACFGTSPELAYKHYGCID